MLPKRMNPNTSLDYRTLCARLATAYDDPDEGRDVALLLLERGFGLSLTDVATGCLSQLPPDERDRLAAMVERLERHEPVQYVLGEATFCGRDFCVSPAVLIPRPETEELCRTIIGDWQRPFRGLQPPAPLQVLDIGTGSGCIAITVAKELPCSEVTAWDVSADALMVARQNGHRLQTKVNWQLQDALTPPPDSAHWDIIVSNPPYITEQERCDMRANVLDHEPPLALFVPNDDPLRFYRAIARYAATALRPNGRLYFEINPLFAADTVTMLQGEGFTPVDVLTDQRGRQRMVRGGRP